MGVVGFTFIGSARHAAGNTSRTSTHTPTPIPFYGCAREEKALYAWSTGNMNKSPNQALQRTRLRVTAPAASTAFPPTMQVPRRSGVSLSLRSLGDSTHS